MLGWFKTRSTMRANAKQLYGTSVTQARHETFYANWSVPDNLTGRFEMIVLHLFLLVERLQKEAAPGQELARAVLEAFVIDIDDHMREVGIADLKVPKHVKKAAAIAYDRFGDYGAALGKAGQGGRTGQDDICRLLLDYVYGAAAPGNAGAAVSDQPDQDADTSPPLTLATPEQAAGARAIGAYMRGVRQALAAQSDAEVMSGRIEFPDPSA